MKRCFLTILLILVCLFLAVYKCFAWSPAPDVYIADWHRYTEVGNSVSIYADVISGGPIDYWSWSWPSALTGSYDEYSYDSTATVSSDTSGQYTVYADGTDFYGQSDSDWAYVYIYAVTSVVSDKDAALVNEDISFVAITDPSNPPSEINIGWTKDGSPAGGGVNFITNWSSAGTKTVAAICGSSQVDKSVDIVSMSSITFTPTELVADGSSSSDADADIEPNTRTIEWSIDGDARGCTIDSLTGLITVSATTTPGTITVRATDSGLSTCTSVATIEILSPVMIESVTITSDADGIISVNEDVTFEVTTNPTGHENSVNWSGGGSPSTATGSSTFTTKWSSWDSKTVIASLSGGDSKSASVMVVEVESVYEPLGFDPIRVGIDVTYQAVINPSNYAHLANWSGGENPSPTGTGQYFTTNWSSGGTKTVTAFFDNSSASESTIVVGVESVSANPTTAAVGQTVTFTANPNPTGAPLDGIEWEMQYRPDSVSPWGAWGAASGGDNTAQLTTSTPGLYKYRARNGSDDIWKESPEVTIVSVSSVDVDKTSASVSEIVTFTANPNPTGSPLNSIQWEQQYRPDSSSPMGTWGAASGGDNTAQLTTSTPGLYKYRARNGSGDVWKESLEITITDVVTVDTVVEAGTGLSGPLIKAVGDSFSLEAKPLPVGAPCPSGGVDWSMESSPPGSSWTLPSNSPTFIVPIQITSPGNYTIRGKCGPSDTGATIDIVVVEVVNVTASANIVAAGEDVLFTAETNPAGYGSLVTWPGGYSGPQHSTSWSTGGTKTVTASCGTSSVTKDVIVVEVVSVTASDNIVSAGEDVTFTATTLPAGHGSLVTWSGGYSGPQYSTSWSTGGTKTMTASCGTSNATTDVIVVQVDTISQDKSTVSIDEDVTFTITTIPAGHSNLVDWSGGGNPTGASGVSQFTTNWSTWSLTKTVYANCGSSSVSATVTVVQLDSITPDKSAASVGGDVTFTATTLPSGNGNLVTWDGGGNPLTASGSQFLTNWSTAGTKTVTATCGNNLQASVDIVSVQIMSCPDQLVMGSTATALATITPSTRTITWSIQSADPLGCTIDSSTGFITAGTTTGTIRIRAADSALSSCWDERTINIVNISVEITYCPDLLAMNSTATASATITPVGRTLTWSIEGDAKGCTIDSSTGEITAGTPATSTGGVIYIKAADSEFPDLYNDYDSLTLFGVRIITPDTYPANVAVGEELPLDCEPIFLDPSVLDPLYFPGSGLNWEQASGLGTVTFSYPGIKNPTFLADQTGDYSVTVNNKILDVIASDTSGTINVVDVTVDITGPLAIGLKDPTIYGLNTVLASVDTTPDGRSVEWSIVGNALGCTIDTSTGEITPGTTTGAITIMATDPVTDISDTATVNIFKVEIDSPDDKATEPREKVKFVKVGESLSLTATVTPYYYNVTTANFGWAVISGPAGAVFSGFSAGNKTASPHEPYGSAIFTPITHGIYIVEVSCTIDDGTANDISGEIIVFALSITPPGSLGVGVNNDDDNENSESDYHNEQACPEEQGDLVQFGLSVEGGRSGDYIVFTMDDIYNFTVWSDGIKTTKILPDDEYDVEKRGYPIGSLPAVVYVEGKNFSSFLGASLQLQYLTVFGVPPQNDVFPSQDLVSPPAICDFTVLKVDMDMEGVIDDDSTVTHEIKPGGFIRVGQRVELTLNPVEPQTLTGPVVFNVTSGADKVKIYDSPTGGNEIQVPTNNPPYTTPSGLLEPDLSSKKLYVEGVKASDALRDVEFSMKYTKDNHDFYDIIKATVIDVDLDIDSDNDDGFAQPKGDEAEDQIEDDPLMPGKYIMVNDDDNDNDGVPDFADGFDLDGQTVNDDDENNQENFIPLVLKVIGPVEDLSASQIKFTYEASNPAGFTPSGTAPDLTYTPAPGTLRIWTEVGNVKRKKESFKDASGDFVEEGIYTAEQFGFSTVDTEKVLYVEALMPSSSLGSTRILVEVDFDGDDQFEFQDAVRVTAIKIDADVDTDNNNGFLNPLRSLVEDHYEDAENKTNRPGKIILVNDDDDDNDSIPDFADGYDRDGLSGTADEQKDDSTMGEEFTPMVLQLHEPIDLTKAKIKLIYDASEPTSVTRTGSPPDYEYTPGVGNLRIWMKDGNQARNKVSILDTTPGDYVPSGFSEFDVSKLSFSGGTRTKTLYLEGINPSSGIAANQIKVEVDPDGDGPADYVAIDAVRVTVIKIDLDVDSDQSGAVDATMAEDNIEELNPAMVLPNCDDDDNDGFPDNWTGHLNKYTAPLQTVGDWDLDGSPDAYNGLVDINGDRDDLAELWIHQIPGLPENSTIEITVTQQVSGNHWTGVTTQDMLRIFVPSSPGVLEVHAGDKEIIGPQQGTFAEFKESPSASNDSEQDIAFIKGTDILKLRVEGIELASQFEIKMELKYGTLSLGSDKVLMKVAPFELRNQTMSVSRGLDKTVFVSVSPHFYTRDNLDLRTKLGTEYGPSLDEVVDPLSYDIWHQDGYEVGRAGNMVIFLVSPRAYRDVSGQDAVLARYVHNMRLADGIGVCWRLEGIGTYTTYDSFGNVECRPTGNNLFCGRSLHSDIKEFFEAQGVNPRLEVNTDWLTVGHVDEVVSFMPNGATVVADPVVHLGLCVWADSSDWNASPTPNPATAFNIIGGAPSYNFGTVVPNMNNIRTALGLTDPLTVPVKNGNSALPSNLTRGGVFTAWLPAGVITRKYRISFDQSDNIHYSVSYEDNNSGSWNNDTNFYGCHSIRAQTGNASSNIKIDADCIFKDSFCFILKEFWQNIGLINPGDYFEFEVDANCTTLEMPVVFYAGDAYSINHVNSLVDGSKVFSGETHEVNTGGVFQDYLQKVFDKGGCTTIPANSLIYHYGGGNIHCGTNVQR